MCAINRNYTRRGRTLQSSEAYLTRLQEGDVSALSDLITFSESTQLEKKKIADAVLAAYEGQKDSTRIGITGSPGVGKSTFIEKVGSYLIQEGHKVAVLAVDPSSTRTQGSILGDKSRMEQLSRTQGAFVRPSPSSCILGGVNASSKEAIALCEMAGYDIILVETVGVGQSETSISDIVDLTLLLLLPGGGDDIQGIKRGIMEAADLVVIHKADGDRLPLAKKTSRDYSYALQFFGHDLRGWRVPVLPFSSVDSVSCDKLWQKIEKFLRLGKENGYLQELRREQDRKWVEQKVKEVILSRIWREKAIDKNLTQIYTQMTAENVSPYAKAHELLKTL